MPAPSRFARQRAEARGRLAELAAAWLLRLKGYRILAERFRARGGEIDIVARRGGVLVFAEVKLRGDLEAARLAVTDGNQRRIRAAADAWLARHERRADVPLRYDIVAVSPRGLRHIKDAFR
jgi:putative endonuclease